MRLALISALSLVSGTAAIATDTVVISTGGAGTETVVASVDASMTTTTTVLVAPSLTLVNNSATAIDTVTVIFRSGYQSGDGLSVTNPANGGLADFSQSFTTATGALKITGTGSAEAWQTVLRTLAFSTTSTTVADRALSIVLGKATYFSNNGHFYETVADAASITWTDARTAAANHSLFGKQGYLVTITSEEENALVYGMVAGNSWMGASDDLDVLRGIGLTNFTTQGPIVEAAAVTTTEAEGNWYWVTGPEAGTRFSYGDETVVTLTYSRWYTPVSPSTSPVSDNQPNNNAAAGENFGLVYANGFGNSYWNDYVNDNPKVKTYVVEYGGMPGDPDAATVTLNADVTISVSSDTTAPVVAIDQQGVTSNDSTPILSGTVDEAGSLVVTVSRGGISTSAAMTVASAGAWSFDSAAVTWSGEGFPVLADGDILSVSAVATDAAGNVGAEATGSLVMDLAAPAAPIITSPGATTAASFPVIAGTAEPGATLTVTVDPSRVVGSADIVTYTVVAEASGNWTIDSATAVPVSGTMAPLESGESLNILAVARDAVGNIGPQASASTTRVIDDHAVMLDDRRCGLGSNMALGGLLGLFALARFRRSRRTLLSGLLLVSVGAGAQAEETTPATSAPAETTPATSASADAAPAVETKASWGIDHWLVQAGIGAPPAVHGGNERVSGSDLTRSEWLRTWRVGVAAEWQPASWQRGNQGGIVRLGLDVQRIAGEEDWLHSSVGDVYTYRDRLVALPLAVTLGWQWKPTEHVRLVAAPRLAAGPIVGTVEGAIGNSEDRTWAYGVTLAYGMTVEAWWESTDRRFGLGALVGYEVQRASFSYRLRDTWNGGSYTQAYDRRIDLDGWWWSLAANRSF